MDTIVVIDMQTAWLANPARPCCESARVVDNINHATASVRARGGKVIFVQHADSDAPAGSAPWQLLAALTVSDTDCKVEKLACDAFAGTNLAGQLDVSDGGTLYLCGFATEFCVDTTVRAAASRGLQVVVLADAHTTSNRPHLDARSIIAHHNWVWTNMAVPANSTLRVAGTAEAFPGPALRALA